MERAMKSYSASDATLIIAALDLAVSSYQRLSANQDMPPKLADAFLDYAQRLKTIYESVQDADHVIFK